MTPLLENKNALVYGERLRGRRGRSCVRKRGGEGLPRRAVVQPGSDGLRVSGIRSRTRSRPQALHWHDSIASIE